VFDCSSANVRRRRVNVRRYTTEGQYRYLVKEGEMVVFHIDDGTGNIYSADGVCTYYTTSREYKMVNGQILLDTLFEDSGTCN
jgi:hypothetical protein